MTNTIQEVSLTEVISRIRLHRRAVMSIFVIALLSSIVYAVFKRPTYQMEVVMMTAEEANTTGLGGFLGQFGNLAAITGVNLGLGSTELEEAVAVLKSRALTRQFIETHGLIPRLFQKEWDEREKKWKSDDPSDIPTIADAVEKFHERIRTITIDDRAKTVKLTIEWHDRVEGTRWANELVKAANQEMQQRAIGESRNSIDYLTAEAKKTDLVELRQSIYKVIESQVNRMTIASTRDEYAFRVLDHAVVPDADDFVWPRRALVVALGVVAGVLLAGGYVVMMSVVQRFRVGNQVSGISST